VDQPEGERDRAAPGEPRAVDQVFHGDEDDRRGDRGFDDAAAEADQVQGGQRQRDAVRDGEERDDRGRLTEGLARQEQGGDEQQVVVAGQDVLDAEAEEARAAAAGTGRGSLRVGGA
jgi:hypothetical protein